MGNLQKAALFWCKIKQYITLIFIVIAIFFIINGVTQMTSNKETTKNYIQGRTRVIFGTLGSIVLIAWYFFLKTNIGCGLAIASNVYGLAGGGKY